MHDDAATDLAILTTANALVAGEAAPAIAARLIAQGRAPGAARLVVVAAQLLARDRVRGSQGSVGMTSAALHQFGRAALLQAWPLETGVAATLPELQIAAAVASVVEGTNYGMGTFRNRHVVTDENGNTTFDTPGDAITNTNNWGAVQSKSLPPCPDGTFEATDSSPNKRTASNPQGLYQACFLRPATPAEGARKFIHEITVRRPLSWAAMRAGDIDAFSDAMHREHYYEGVAPTVAERIDAHAHAVERGVTEVAAALNEPVVAFRGGAPASSGIDAGDVVAGASVLVLTFLGVRELAGRYRRAGGFR